MRVVLILIALLAGAVTEAAAESRLLRSADTHPGDYPTVQAVVFLGRRLSEATGGRLGVRVHHSRLLGEESDTVALAIDGGLDMARVNLALLAKLSEEAAIATLPYLFRSPGHMHTVLDGAIGAEILASLEPAGLVGLAFYDSGARSFYTVDKPVRSPADLAGLKIRVQNSESAMAMVRALGATPTPLEFGQVQDALKVKVIDGAENNWPSYETTGHYTVARFYTLDEHSMTPDVLVMSKKTWDGLSAESRAALRDAAAQSVPYMRQLWETRENAARAKLAAADVRIIDGIDKQPFMAAMRPLYDKATENPKLKTLVERIWAID